MTPAARTARLMTLIVLTLTAASLLVATKRTWLVEQGLGQLFRLFYLDEEANIPTWYQSSALLLCALRMRYIAWVKDGLHQPDVVHWKVLSLLLAFMSLDELVSIHELASGPTRHWLKTTGFFYYAWVVPALALVAAVGLAYLPFVLRLPPRLRWRLLLAGSLYLSGAVGLELVGGYLAESHDTELVSPAYVLVSTLEELLEMVGVVILMSTLLLPEATSMPRQAASETS